MQAETAFGARKYHEQHVVTQECATTWRLLFRFAKNGKISQDSDMGTEGGVRLWAEET